MTIGGAGMCPVAEGNDRVTINGLLAATNVANINVYTTIAESFVIDLGTGNDIFNSTIAAIGGSLSFTGGDGIEQINITGLVDPLNGDMPYFINENFDLNLGAGVDVFKAVLINVRGSVTIIGGDGNDEVRIHGIANTTASTSTAMTTNEATAICHSGHGQH